MSNPAVSGGLKKNDWKLSLFLSTVLSTIRNCDRFKCRAKVYTLWNNLRGAKQYWNDGEISFLWRIPKDEKQNSNTKHFSSWALQHVWSDICRSVDTTLLTSSLMPPRTHYFISFYCEQILQSNLSYSNESTKVFSPERT